MDVQPQAALTSHLRALQPEKKSEGPVLGSASTLLPRPEPKKNRLLEAKTESGPGKKSHRKGLDERSFPIRGLIHKENTVFGEVGRFGLGFLCVPCLYSTGKKFSLTA